MRLSLRLMAERGGRDDRLGGISRSRCACSSRRALLRRLVTHGRRDAAGAGLGLESARGLPRWRARQSALRRRLRAPDSAAHRAARPERVLEILLPSFAVLARLLKPLTAALVRLLGAPRAASSGDASDARASTAQEPDGFRAGARRPPAAARSGCRRAGTRTAAVDRRLPRHDGARGDDAAARHRGHRGERDARRAARRWPRAGVLAHPGLPGDLDNILGIVS
jgi:hypothetical protein